MKKCDHCGAKEGHKRPIGRYIVELHTMTFEGKELELCMTCFKHFRSMKRHNNEHSGEDDQDGFFSPLIKLYRDAFHLEHQD